MDALGVLRPDRRPPTPPPTSTDMVALVAELVDRGVAYETADGVYLEVDQVPGYGLLARQPLESLRAGARVEAIEEKRSPLDFVLWKKAKPGEPQLALALGPGPAGLAHRVRGHVPRPAGRRLRPPRRRPGPAFPHHENERAQAVAVGRAFAQPLGAQRLGGGRGREDVQVARQLHLAHRPAGPRTTPRAYRLLVLRSHYRSPIEVTAGDRGRRRGGPRAAGRPGPAVLPGRPPGRRPGRCVGRPRARRPRSTPRPWPRSRRDGRRPGHPRRHGRRLRAGAAGQRARPTPATPTAAARLARTVRRAVRGPRAALRGRERPRSTPDRPAWPPSATRPGRARDWARADAIRDELAAGGWTVEDGPEGTVSGADRRSVAVRTPGVGRDRTIRSV